MINNSKSKNKKFIIHKLLTCDITKFEEHEKKKQERRYHDYLVFKYLFGETKESGSIRQRNE
jgi:hypothetical protein